MYYVHLLKELQDLETLRLITPKVRKASSLVVDHASVWEYLCTTFLRVCPFYTFLTLATPLKVGD